MVNTSDFDVYFKFSNYTEKYIDETTSPDEKLKYQYQADFHLFVCPNGNCKNITDLKQIKDPF